MPGEEWSIWTALAGFYEDLGDHAEAQEAWKASAAIILRLAETIDDTDIRAGFLTAQAVQPNFH